MGLLTGWPVEEGCCFFMSLHEPFPRPVKRAFCFVNGNYHRDAID